MEQSTETDEGGMHRADEGGSSDKWFVPSITFVVLALTISSPIITVLTQEIAITFFGEATQATVGYTLQLNTIINAANVVTALVMSILLIRFRHKALYIVGILLSVLSSMLAFLAPTFFWMQVSFAIGGIAGPMVTIVGITLIGDFLPQSRKAKVVSYLIAALYLASIVGSRAVGFLADFGTWRYAYLLLAMPFTVVALVIAFFGIPSKLHKPKTAFDRAGYAKSFRQILGNKSALACLIGSVFFSGAIGTFAVNFYRQQFWFDLSRPLQREYSSYVMVVSLLLFAVGSLVAGRLVNRVGAKKLTIIGAVGDGIFVILLFSISDLWISLAFNWMHVWFATTATTALALLALDQVPKARGTMMSLNRMFSDVGNATSTATGGALLTLFPQASLGAASFGYQSLGIVLGVLSIVAAIVILFVANDPTRALLRKERESKLQ